MRPQILFEWLDSENLLLDSVSIKYSTEDLDDPSGQDLQDVVYRDHTGRAESAWLLLDWNQVYQYIAAQIASHKPGRTRYRISIDGFSPISMTEKAIQKTRNQDILCECMEVWHGAWIQVPA